MCLTSCDTEKRRHAKAEFNQQLELHVYTYTLYVQQADAK